jgi:hypothetical protein
MCGLGYKPSFSEYFVIIVFILVLSSFFLLPLGELQKELWIASIVTYLIGDTITTGMLGKFGLEEGQRYTRRICGKHPSMRCSLLTRGFGFVGISIFYILAIQSDIPIFNLVALFLPLMLAIAGLIATIWNLYGIVTSVTNEGALRQS